MPVGGRGQEVSADWKCPTDGFQVTTMRRVLERGANESLRWVAGRRGWERCDTWQEQPRQTRAGGSFSGPRRVQGILGCFKLVARRQGEGRGPSPPLGAAWFRGQILGLPSKGLRESGGLLVFRPITIRLPRRGDWLPAWRVNRP
jgi:hypothetical protein